VHHRSGWDYYRGYHDHLGLDVVGPTVVGPGVVGPTVVGPGVVGPTVVGPAVVMPSVSVKRVFIVKLYAPRDGRNHIEAVVGSNYERVRERVLQKYSGADFKSIHEKAAVGGEDVYVVKFSTPGDGKNHAVDILASSGDKAKEKVLESNSGAVFTSVEVKPVIDAR
jgi:hypothetical protein